MLFVEDVKRRKVKTIGYIPKTAQDSVAVEIWNMNFRVPRRYYSQLGLPRSQNSIIYILVDVASDA